MTELTPREIKVLKLRYGLTGNNVIRSRSQVAKCFKVTRERIRQIENHAILKIFATDYISLELSQYQLKKMLLVKDFLKKIMKLGE